MTVARTGAHQCAVDDGSGSSSDCDCASAAAVATAAAASSTSAASFCCCLPAGASPLYTVCRHTHAYTHTHTHTCVCFSFLLLFHCFVCITHIQATHAHYKSRTRMGTYNLCMRLCAYHVCPPGACVMWSEQSSAVTKPKRRWAAAAIATAAEQHDSRYRQRQLAHKALPSQPKLYFLSPALSLSLSLYLPSTLSLFLFLSLYGLLKTSVSAVLFDRAPAGVDCRRSVLFGLSQSMICLGIARQIESCKGTSGVRCVYVYMHACNLATLSVSIQWTQ